MESGAVARVAQEAGVPFMAVRAIADSADMAIPQGSLGALDEFGELNLLRLFKGLIRHPLELFDMIRLGWNFRAAQVTLSKVARLAGSRSTHSTIGNCGRGISAPTYLIYPLCSVRSKFGSIYRIDSACQDNQRRASPLGETMKTLITGASGFVGSAISRQLVAAGLTCPGPGSASE